MPLSAPLFDESSLAAARILLDRRRRGEQGDGLPSSCNPLTLASAFAIQSAVSNLQHSPIVAWKCGMPSADKWIVAPIYADQVHRVDSNTDRQICPVWGRNKKLKIEAELAFLLSHDLPVREQAYTEAEVNMAIASTRLALELIDTRYAEAEQRSFYEHLADGLFNQGLLLGPVIDNDQGQSTREMAISLCVEGENAVTIAGRHPAGQPRLPLYWLANFLRSQGIGLQAGQAIITGAYAGSPEVPLDTDISVQFAGLGQIQVRFEGK